MCLYEAVTTILYLHLSLMVCMHEDISYYLYKGISTVVHLLLSLPASLRNGSLHSSLPTSLSSLLVSMRNGILKSSLLASLQSNFVRASPMTTLWKIFLRRVYKFMSTVAPIQVKPEITKSWVPSNSSLQTYMKDFYKLITYYMIGYNLSINSDNIKKQVVGYIMSLKRK